MSSPCFAAMAESRRCAESHWSTTAASQRGASNPLTDRRAAQPVKRKTKYSKLTFGMSVRMRELFFLNVRKPDGQLLRLQWHSDPGMYRLETRHFRKVCWIKVRICEELMPGCRSYEPPFMALVFGSQVLQSFRTLKSYGIHSGSELTLVFLAHHPRRHQPC